MTGSFSQFGPTQIWVSQFPEGEERTAAALLVDSLDLVTGSEAERQVAGLLTTLGNETPDPIALFTMRKLSNKEFKTHYFGSLRDKTTQPRKLESLFGSDGRTGHLTRDLANAYPQRFLDHPSIEMMRAAYVKRIALVDDVVGSGTRAVDFVKHLYRHASLKSWNSLGRLDFYIVAYAVSSAARTLVRRLKKPRASLLYARGVGSLEDTGLSDEEMLQIRTLCRRYAKSPAFALGYRESEGILVLDYACPNNVPQILWQPKEPTEALFPRKHVPAALRDAFGTATAPKNASTRLARMGVDVESAGLDRLPYGVVPIFLFLYAIRKKARRGLATYHFLSVYSGLTIQQCIAVRQICVSAGILSRNNRLTDAGYREFRRMRSLAMPAARFDGLKFPYYPRSLRGS